jgi:hypothetical protein
MTAERPRDNYGLPVHLRLPGRGNGLACGAGHMKTINLGVICCRLDLRQVTCSACRGSAGLAQAGRRARW